MSAPSIDTRDETPRSAAQLLPAAYGADAAAALRQLDEAARVARRYNGAPIVDLRTTGPRNLPYEVTGTVRRRVEPSGKLVVELVPDDKKLEPFLLSPRDAQGVATSGQVTVRRIGSGREQRLIIERHSADTVRDMVGTVEVVDGKVYLAARAPTAPITRLPLPGVSPALAGQTALARVHSGLDAERYGTLEELLPASDAWRATFLELAVNHGVEASFSPQAKDELARIERLFDPEHIEGYQDLTGKPFFSIDNPYSKDFDQAMHIEASAATPGAHDVYYAIADTSYFLGLLGPDSALAKRVTEQQTTTFMPGLDVPIYGRRMCEDLCSLVQGKKRPAFLIKFTVGADGRVVGGPTFIDAVIENRANSNYPAAQRYYDGRGAADPGLTGGFDLLRDVGGRLLAAARQRGMLTSQEGERWGGIDASGKKLELEKRGQLWVEEANAQISITANALIGQVLHAAGVPSVHRVHLPPEPRREEAARRAVAELGLVWPADLPSAKFLEGLDLSDPRGRAARRLVLRAQPKAVVRSTSDVHHGLQLDRYAQSTAPLRRERDRRNHTAARALRDGAQVPELDRQPEIAELSRRAERRAILIDREIHRRLAASALEPLVGETLEVSVTSVGPWGVELYIPKIDAELSIPVEQLPGKAFRLEQQGVRLTAIDGGFSVRAGTSARLRLDAVRPHAGEIDLRLLTDGAARPAEAAARPATKAELAQVRGDGFTSPLTGQVVTTTGVVTSGNVAGFFIQPSEGGGGLFVRTKQASVRPGDLVEVTGLVRERGEPDAPLARGVVELVDRPQVRLLPGRAALPTPIVLGGVGQAQPPDDNAGATEFWRKLLGQRVRIERAISLSPSREYGDLVVLPEGWQVPDELRSPHGGVLYKAGHENHARCGLKFRDHVGGLPPTSVGDKIEGIEGVVIYRSGDFQIELSSPARISAGAPIADQPTRLVGTREACTVASMNALNMSPLQRGRAKNLAERIVRDLRAPDVIALQEIQDNDGPQVSGVTAADKSYQMLIELIVKAGGPRYAWADVAPQNGCDGGEPGGNIRCGYLYRVDRVQLVPGSVRRFAETNAAFDDSRKPLTARFVFDGHEIEVVNNHFASRRGSSPWNGATQPPVIGNHDKRLTQAEVVGRYAAQAQAARPNTDVLIVGDANDMPGSATLRALAGATLRDLHELMPPGEAYDYNYRGTLQALTMAVGGDRAVREGRIEAEHVHANALKPLFDSDHDHLVVRITKPAARA